MLPENGTYADFKYAVLNVWPVLELIDRMQPEGVHTHSVKFHHDFVSMEISWHMAHEDWGHPISLGFVRTLVETHAAHFGLKFTHWVVATPKEQLWLETIETKAKEAKIFLRVKAFTVEEAQAFDTKCLASSLQLSEEQEKYDQNTGE